MAVGVRWNRSRTGRCARGGGVAAQHSQFAASSSSRTVLHQPSAIDIRHTHSFSKSFNVSSLHRDRFSQRPGPVEGRRRRSGCQSSFKIHGAGFQTSSVPAGLKPPGAPQRGERQASPHWIGVVVGSGGHVHRSRQRRRAICCDDRRGSSDDGGDSDESGNDNDSSSGAWLRRNGRRRSVGAAE